MSDGGFCQIGGHILLVSSNANYEKTSLDHKTHLEKTQISFETRSQHTTLPYNLPITLNEFTIAINKNSKNTSPGLDFLHA